MFISFNHLIFFFFFLLFMNPLLHNVFLSGVPERPLPTLVTLWRRVQFIFFFIIILSLMSLCFFLSFYAAEAVTMAMLRHSR